ncbi:MAG TPA: TIGR02281 family clan AA aspartic protease, partial [Hyphomicrobiaceae bacterium]|nr:TIGR02281 family clan AA aspartic protease [Hyphomicrobiaceae bacterium]
MNSPVCASGPNMVDRTVLIMRKCRSAALGRRLAGSAATLALVLGSAAVAQQPHAGLNGPPPAASGPGPSGPSSGATVTYQVRSKNGHFYVPLTIASRAVTMLVDTGATTVVLSAADAERLGIDVRRLRYDTATATAAGRLMVASIELHDVRIGRIYVGRVAATVLPENSGKQSLLGMSVIQKLGRVTVEGESLTIVGVIIPGALVMFSVAGVPPASNARTPPLRPAPPPTSVSGARLGWGALALSADAYGWSRGYATRSEAERVALDNCRKHAKRDQCDVRAFDGSLCAAVATWSFMEGSERRFGNIGNFG